MSGGRGFCGVFGAIWGILGITILLGSAVVRLFPYAYELREWALGWGHGVALALSVIGLGYMEGYRGFQLRFSPRTAARALYLSENPTWARLLFAPLFCMGFFHATRRRRFATMVLTLGIVGLVLGVRQLAQPWRGIVDAGVVVGLSWGLVSVWYYTLKAFFSSSFCVCPETPDATEHGQ